MKVLVIIAAGAAMLFAGARRTAHACTPAPAVKPFALPRPTAASISTATSIYIVSLSRPSWVEVTAGGTLQKTDGLKEMDQVYLPNAQGKLWKVLGLDILTPSTEYVVSMEDIGGRVELTRFTTASGYDKNQGVAPKLRSVELWRVHYPPDKVGGGECITAEYQGAIKLDYDPATLPDTPAESMLYTIQIHPKTGGPSQSRHFLGSDLFKGNEPQPPDYGTEYPPWPSDLDPTREYCVGIAATGYGDIARLPLTSSSVCATVTALPSGAPSDGGTAGDGAPSTSDMGAGDSSHADLAQSPGVSRSGCTVALSVPTPCPGAFVLLSLLVALLRVVVRIRTR